jgi:hypothetical protein
VVVEGDAADLVDLGGLLPGAGPALGDAGANGEDVGLESTRSQVRGAESAAAGAGDHGEPDEHALITIGPRFGGDTGGLFRRWVASARGGRLGAARPW